MRARQRRIGLPALLLPVALLISPADATAAECRYDVVVSDAIAGELSVTIDCDGGLPEAFDLSNSAGADWMSSMVLSDGTVVEPVAARWIIPEGQRDGSAQYHFALREMALHRTGHESALASDEAVLVPLDVWLAVPIPFWNWETISISFSVPDGANVATSLPLAEDGRYRIATALLGRAGPTIFGTFARIDVPVPSPASLNGNSGSTTDLNLVILDSAMASNVAALTRWVSDSARAVAEFWRGFPVDRPLTVLAPVDGSEVPFGRVTSDAGITVMVLVGRDAESDVLYRDWVLIHEMLHLGSPSMHDTGAWLNEGIATFYEPIVRLRAGWKTRDEVWREWIEWMPNGLRAMGEVGLADAQGGGVYWGGALFLLLAEIEVRQRTNLELGIEDCLRDIRDAGGTVDSKWTTQRFLDLCDATFGGMTVSNLMINHLGPADPPDLDALWAQLGVSMAADGTIAYDDSAPLAAVRDAILGGGPNAKWQPVPFDTE